jgi:hypothetical protein
MRGLPPPNLDKSEARNVPFHVPVADPLPVSGGVFQVVKTASSRGRTGRTLLRLLFLLSTGAHGGAGMLRTGVIRRFRVTFTVATPKSSRRHALMLSRWLAAVHELRAPVQGQTGPSLRRR